VQKLGEGGMGIVYLAEDTRLKRFVAIKFLPKHIASDSDERKRFEIEAQAAAALNHPAIATIHAIEECEGELFLVMEYIDGKELKEIIAENLLSREEALVFAISIANGILAAHEKGISHRDIKSSNIMITEKGDVKIMDFGVAKFPGISDLTKKGTTIGTTAYMSPEHAKGEEADQKSDIWSFGVILYELVTGQLPFNGEYEHAVIYSIINEEPQLDIITDEGMKFIIEKTLQKHPDKRYQNISEVLADLNEIKDNEYLLVKKAGDNKKQRFKASLIYSVSLIILCALAFLFIIRFASQPEKIDSIAVLPLINLSGNIDQEYISDGVTDALITELSKIEALRVISRQSVMRFKNSMEPLNEIAAKLKVDAIIEGSVILVDKHIQIRTKLVNAKNEKHLWSQNYERDFADVITLQKDLVRSIAEEVALQITPQDEARLGKSQPVNPEAFKLYLKGLGEYMLTNFDSYKNAEVLFKTAIKTDPSFGQAYVELLRVQSVLINYGADEAHVSATAEIVKNNYQRLPNAQVALSIYYLIAKGDIEKAGEAIQSAVNLNPGSSEAHREYGLFLGRMTDQYDMSLTEMKKALELDPLSETIWRAIAEIQILRGQYKQAIHTISNKLDTNKSNGELHLMPLGWAYIQSGAVAKGIEVLEKVPDYSWCQLLFPVNAMLGYAYARAGRPDDALNQLEKVTSQNWYGSAAVIHFGMNNTEKVIENLVRNFNTVRHFEKLMTLVRLKTDPFWQPLQKQQEFRALIKEFESQLTAKS
jgi:serine/threonine protein kinase/Tfp pilus assembly protein PilF